MDAQPAATDLSVLADPTRRRIVQLIVSAEGSRALVGELADALGLRQPTVSHHMSVLLGEGVVERHKDGRRAWYSIDPVVRERVSALLGIRSVSGRKDADLARIIGDLTERYRGVYSPETIAAYVEGSHALLAAGDPGGHLASRTALFAMGRLDDLARAEHRAQRQGEGMPHVLFVCVQNAGRSQLAAGILRQLAGDRIVVRTAGSAPRAELRASIVEALDEIGVPIGAEFPKPLTGEAVAAADYVVTMGCGDACPILPGRTYLDWDVADPSDRPMSEVRAIREDIDRRVRALLGQIETVGQVRKA